LWKNKINEQNISLNLQKDKRAKNIENDILKQSQNMTINNLQKNIVPEVLLQVENDLKNKFSYEENVVEYQKEVIKYINNN